MKKVIVLICLLASSFSFSQTNFNVKWTSPAGLYFQSYGFAERSNQVCELIFRDASYNEKVYDGATYQLKYSFSNPDSSSFSYYTSYANSPIDVNNDGMNEIFMLKGYPSTPKLKILDGASGAQLYQNSYPGKYYLNIATLDVDNDSYIEILITEFNTSGIPDKFTILSTSSHAIGVEENQTPVSNFKLGQNYPNPFNPSTKIDYSVSKTSNVVIKLYDVLGKEVRTLLNDTRPAGNYTLDFESEGLASGTYFYQISIDGFSDAKKMVVLK